MSMYWGKKAPTTNFWSMRPMLKQQRKPAPRPQEWTRFFAEWERLFLSKILVMALDKHISHHYTMVDLERPWETLRDLERPCERPCERPWATWRDVEGPWETLRDFERLWKGPCKNSTFFTGLWIFVCLWISVWRHFAKYFQQNVLGSTSRDTVFSKCCCPVYAACCANRALGLRRIQP